jgi:hypothetical protein
MAYNFELETKRVIDAIEPLRGANMTVKCALREAYAAGKSDVNRDLLDALKAAKQFLGPEVSRGPAINGWENTVATVEAAIAKAEGR